MRTAALALLVIDTSLAACQVAVFDGGRRLGAASEAMERGHQERLAPMAGEVMAGAGVGFCDLTRIAVTIGPGSFTGLRVGLAFAKGLRLALGAPLVGIGTLAALAASVAGDGPAAGVIDARRGLVYVQPFLGGRPLAPPEVLPMEAAAARLRELGPGLTLAGPGAPLLGGPLGSARIVEIAAPDPTALARLGAAASADEVASPLYLRAPDARLA